MSWSTRLSRTTRLTCEIEDVVVHMVKELGDVDVHYPISPFPRVPLGGLARSVRAASGTESVAAVAEAWLEQRLHHLSQ